MDTQGYPVKSPIRELLPVVCSFFTNGAGAVNQATLGGYVTSVTRTGVGTFNVVLPDQGILIGALAYLRTGTGPSDVVAGANGYTPATRTLAITLFDVNIGAGTGANADMAADANNQVLVEFWFDGEVAT